MKIAYRFFSQSLPAKLGLALGAIAVAAFAAIISATVFSERLADKASAISLAGSLRTQAYSITTRVLRQDRSAETVGDLKRMVAEFESCLHNPLLRPNISADAGAPERRAYEHVVGVWPDVLAAALEYTDRRSTSTQEALVARVTEYVPALDRLVSLMEDDLERSVLTLRMIQESALVAIISALAILLYLFRARVMVPLADLLQCGRRVGRGDFTVRVRHGGEDELGQLGRSFNHMVTDLANGYSTFEAKVRQKTQQLERSKVSLEILYNTTRTLAENPLTQAALDAVMNDIERVTGFEARAICAREEGDGRGYAIVVREGNTACGEAGCDSRGCMQQRCRECFDDAEARVRSVGDDADRMLAVPLSEGGKLYGVMLLHMPLKAEFGAWKLTLLETIGHHIGAALAAARRIDERHRVALLEERSIIARELHDSLAQSLSYLKIQVARLTALLGHENNREQAAAVLAELRLGINNGYRQLRELLTTFRLRIDGRGLSDALREAIREFSERTNVKFELHDGLLGHELDSSEQIHVLQVVREALTNIEHHARANRATVRLWIEGGHICVTVDDDGVGIQDAEPRPYHYGFAIMHDRAATLGGVLHISARPEGGTRVELVFSPRGPFDTRRKPIGMAA